MKTAKNPEKKRFRLFSYLFNTRMGTMIFRLSQQFFFGLRFPSTCIRPHPVPSLTFP